jgi:hypothetical protein
LVRRNDVKFLGAFHGFFSGELVVHIEAGYHKLDSSHQFGIINARFLQNSKVCDLLVRLWGEARRIRDLAEESIYLCHTLMVGC